MKVREVMSSNPVCCLPSDTAQKVAGVLCDQNIGSVPIVEDQQSRKLIGIITDRDLCCSVVAKGLDPKSTPIEKFVSLNPVTCRVDENLEKCERAMQEHQIRRIPVVDAEGNCIGIVSQADLALKEKPEKVSKTVAEVSRPEKAA
jgi:CBS domain-containing protein